MLKHLFPTASLLAVVACSGGGTSTPVGSAPAPPDGARTYYAYVGAESADLIHRIRLGPDGMSVEQTTPVGEIPVETEGPHGLGVSGDGRHLYMTTAHGVPDGKLWKFEAGVDTLVAAPILLGNFPATLDLTPDGLYAFVVNFNLHGEHVPSTVSVVYTPDLVEVEQVPTCTMPHGMRLSPDGAHAYSMCMMDDQLVEIDTRSFEVTRRFSVRQGEEAALEDYPEPEVHTGALGMRSGADAMSGMDAEHGASEPTCSPTWAEPSPDGRRVFVACNGSDEILVIDREEWVLERRIPTGAGPYNLDVTPDGRILVASLKTAGQVEFFDAETGRSLAVAPSTTTVTHGVAVTPDSRYAFVSVEGKGAEPGKVDVFDLRSFERIDSVEVGQQAGGIVFWKMEPAGS
ncbi:MAG: YncE family protein [Gemmatimonadota bacterium]|nr:YncE family protein [Gemmatimonadota bacterium]